MKKAMLLAPISLLCLLLSSCTIGPSNGQWINATRNAVYKTDYDFSYGEEGLFYVHITLTALNDLSNISLTVNFEDEDKNILEGNTRSCIDLPSGASQTTKFGYSAGIALSVKSYQLVVNATATYSVFR